MVLDGINKRLEAEGLPPLSAMIVNQEAQMSGGGFWGELCADNESAATRRRSENGAFAHS